MASQNEKSQIQPINSQLTIMNQNNEVQQQASHLPAIARPNPFRDNSYYEYLEQNQDQVSDHENI